MTTINKLLSLIFFVSCYVSVISQNNNLQINLDITRASVYTKNHHVRFSLYQDSLYYISFRNFPLKGSAKSEKLVKRDPDYVLQIREEDYNRIINMAMNLSSEQILEGMSPAEGFIIFDGTGWDLELNFGTDKIIYDISNADSGTKSRQLDPYYQVCKELILLAKKKPKNY